ncbi:MAG: hydrogenase expression/formation protein HypE [Phycisphaeraceae bacterium]|nr:hydrogenase expression/formation protein HypE [Phycisphaeraceae bacterium]
MKTQVPATTPKTPSQREQIVLAHGGGGQLTDELIAQIILPRFGNATLDELTDAAVMTIPSCRDNSGGVADALTTRVALTIDSYVVQPLQFPGGDIGRLCVSGTVNDLAVSGAQPVGLALSLILAEGLSRSLLEQLLDSAAATAKEAGVRIVTGDTKVVGRDQADGMYITTAGVGVVTSGRQPSMRNVQPGDVILINGPIADHGLAVMLAREMPEVQSALTSDVAPLNGLIAELTETVPVVFMRDATRGGLAGVVAELAQRTGLHVSLEESAIPIRPQTLHAAEMLGLDALEVANEGKVVAVVRPQHADAALNALRQHPLGKEACVIGEIGEIRDGLCELRTTIGGRRIIQKPYGEQLPRIC